MFEEDFRGVEILHDIFEKNFREGKSCKICSKKNWGIFIFIFLLEK